MAELNCAACEELRQEVPQLVCNGFDDAMCTSLQNDTGLSASSGHNDCTDLNNLNDCLVGNMETEVDAYEVCDWKTFMKTFIGNLWTTLKAIICAICGIWTNIHSLWTKINEILNNIDKINCMLGFMNRGKAFVFGEYATDTKSHIVAGKGVSFLNVGASGTANDITLEYIAGGLARLVGSCLFYDSNFTDRAACYNYDDSGVNPTKTSSRKGNSNWASSNSKPGGATSGSGTELVYELRILRSEYPQIAALFPGVAVNAEGGGYHGEIRVFGAGQYADGQHGRCDRTNGNPVGTGSDRGHLVPSGWTYIQMRITWIEAMSANGTQYTPNGLLGIRMNPNAIEC